MTFTAIELSYLVDACSKAQSNVRRMAESCRYDEETTASLHTKAEALDNLRQRFAGELAAAHERLSSELGQIAGRRCHWCKKWVSKGTGHVCGEEPKS